MTKTGRNKAVYLHYMLTGELKGTSNHFGISPTRVVQIVRRHVRENYPSIYESSTVSKYTANGTFYMSTPPLSAYLKYKEDLLKNE